MYIRILLTLVLSCLSAAVALADSVDDMKEQINKVKKVRNTSMPSPLHLRRKAPVPMPKNAYTTK